MKHQKLSVRNRIWIDDEKGTFLGNGRIQLLEKISESGSINNAAKELNMSYKKAWMLVQKINNHSDVQYIVQTTGGKGGGGSLITPAGLNAIREFKKLDKKCKIFLEHELRKIKF